MKSCFVIVLGALVLLSCEGKKQSRILEGEAMGTSWKLAWRGAEVESLKEEVSEVLEKWEGVMSQWREDSDLSRANRGEPVSAELKQVIKLAEEMRLASNGAFDYRLLKPTHQAGFGPSGEGMDLSAIGKGFAVDRVGERLKKLGITDFVFEFGGEVLVGDGYWTVGIEKPDPTGGGLLRKVQLKQRALATSGNYRQFRPVTEGLAGHIISPETGNPIIRKPSSVTVYASDCATADAWATALFVLGPEYQAPAEIEVEWNDEPPP